MMVISTISFVALTITSSYAFAQSDCPSRDTCAQSDLSLPVPSENDFAPPGLQQNPGDHSQDADENSGSSDDESGDNGISNDESTFLLPFP
jgi:hypothetical protein